MDDPGLSVDNLTVAFSARERVLHAVRGLCLDVRRGRTIGLIGESGSGKSVSALALMRLLPTPPARIVSGRVTLDGVDLLALPLPEMRRLRGNRISMIFQEPMTSLNPVFTVGDQIAEVFRIHHGLSRRAARDGAAGMLAKVGIPEPHQRLDEYPHQLSGGMRQRTMIAMALSCRPAILLADEPTTALDVTIQSQILSLLVELQQESGTGILLITHDLGLVSEVASRVAVMYAGEIVEEGAPKDLMAEPLHPYTRGLLRSLPRLRRSRSAPKADRLQTIPGIVPDLAHLPRGCPFGPRCGDARPECAAAPPPLVTLGSRSVRCFLHGDAAGGISGKSGKSLGMSSAK